MEKKGNKKHIIIVAAIVVAVAIAVVCLILAFSKKEEVYRLIKVFELDGKATVSRVEIGDVEAYENMVLESGDSVYVNQGMLTLKMDDDKYAFAEENTIFSIIAKGDAANSKTTINLEQGAITNEIQNKLSEDSSYEINTPNSSMSVRGTVYRVYSYTGDDGIKYTVVAVFEGTVATRLRYADGTMSEEEVVIEKGKQIIIYEDSETTDYLTGPQDIDYSMIPDNVLAKLNEILKDGIELPFEITEVTEESEDEEDEGPFTVTFKYNGSVFGTQTVEAGKCATVPSLAPAQTGGWDFNFSTPITEDTEIIWLTH